MSPAEQNLNSDKPDRSIETIYTTVESQRDQTDWLTVVSNLRQINRQLLEEIARLEQALASAKQSLHVHKEANQTHEITILQQQDELRIAHDRVGALFQQLENSHQIGQRQQTLIETLSQQLEITQAIVPQIEAEHDELCQKYQQQSQKLTKTEQVAIELHRRLKLLQANTVGKETSTTATTTDPVEIEIIPATTDPLSSEIVDDTSTLTFADRSEILTQSDTATNPSNPPVSALSTSSSESNLSTAEIDPAPPLAPLQLPEEIPNWSPSAPIVAKTILSPPKSAAATGWREAISSNNRYYPTLDNVPGFTPPAPETVNKESTAIDDPTPKSAPNWPAPTIDRDPLQDSNVERPVVKTVTIDLPKFPKKVDS
jgi:hypothetical protein